MDSVEVFYSELETDLRLRIANTEADYPGYHEYRYDIGEISHNPLELMAYLTARFQSFTFTDVEAELRSIFNEQYVLTLRNYHEITCNIFKCEI